MPKVEKTFNKLEYDKKYRHEKYKSASVTLTKEEAAQVEAAAKAAGLSKSSYIKKAVFEKMQREG